ncbi:Zinc finger protein-like protein [Hapsidospora chrysogenum ATCC 11550]|uniref:Zinc finger protein-like protein n=1 Tax=Hapsidospora chrysogenum (strain ATCC 11550 / CBS 779.69 / DSM 880 / IAM 14645 / JCM 23072 / IMI 49137) TaxID=857340 RepID=A0A086T6S2_HAPC1|nr:Zinc finger protein-like protein [Hapsidospora chrysogenum ATCC 11550]
MSRHYAGHRTVPYDYARPPPSPPMEQPRCTLPSISNLIGLADAGSPTHETPEAPSLRRTPGIRSDSRPGSGYAKGFPHHQRGFPPSPPMSTDAPLDTSSPPQKLMSHSNAPATPSGYYHETTPPLESDHQRHHQMAPPPQPRHSHQHAATTPSATHAPSGSSYFPPTAPPPPSHSHSAGMAYQRPLPQSFPPVNAAVSVAPSSGAISWQHHHYLNPAPGHLFPQSQDRYICQTCNKAFSRPSSLRIHSHSHTGEKPFKCSQAGCGKAFSVRSNMKRHERGCHSVEVKPAEPAMSS